MRLPKEGPVKLNNLPRFNRYPDFLQNESGNTNFFAGKYIQPRTVVSRYIFRISYPDWLMHCPDPAEAEGYPPTHIRRFSVHGGGCARVP